MPASQLIMTLGPDQSRYEHIEDLLTFTGIAPVIKRSGNMTVALARWFCPKLLRQSFDEFAGQSTQHIPRAKALRCQQRMRGKNHQASVRSLALKWARIIFQLWKNRMPYYEHIYVAA